MSKVKKRDGSLVDFDSSKIISALSKAYKEKGKEIDIEQWKQFISTNFDQSVDEYDIEFIQDSVQKELIQKDYEVGLSFILYRDKRKTDREFAKEQMDFVKKYIKSSNTANATVDDNSNVGNKNVGVLNAEIHKERNINSNREWEKRKLRELFPDENLDKQYIKDLMSHVFYKNDENSFPFPVSYCLAGSMYPFLLNGLMQLGGKSSRPKNIDSFCGLYINLVFALSGMFAGAVALPETLVYMDWFARKEWGDDYYKTPDAVITSSVVKRQMTIKGQIHQCFQQIIHSINQPSGARGQQSAFVNFSIFDKPFFDGMFGNFYFDSETMEQPKWESVQWLQEVFMEWFNAERLKTMLTFPVVSVTLLRDKTTGKFVDQRMKDFVCKEWSEGDSFFVYISDSVDSLSSCCFDGDEIIKIIKNGEEKLVSIKDFVNEYDNVLNQQGTVINTECQIISYNKDYDEQEVANINGILKKEYTGKMFTFEVGEKSIKVTAEHLMLVKNVQTNEIIELCAEKVFENKDNYLIAVE